MTSARAGSFAHMRFSETLKFTRCICKQQGNRIYACLYRLVANCAQLVRIFVYNVLVVVEHDRVEAHELIMIVELIEITNTIVFDHIADRLQVEWSKGEP